MPYSHSVAVTASIPWAFLQSPHHLARCSCLGSYQQTPLSLTSGHVVHLSASAMAGFLGTSSRVRHLKGCETHHHHKKQNDQGLPCSFFCELRTASEKCSKCLEHLSCFICQNKEVLCCIGCSKKVGSLAVDLNKEVFSV